MPFNNPGIADTGNEFTDAEETELDGILAAGDSSQMLSNPGGVPTWVTIPVRKMSVSGIDGKVLASTLLGTTENLGKNFRAHRLIVEITAANTIAIVPAISVGTNSTDYNNILAITTLTGLSAVNKIISVDLGLVAMDSVAPNTGIYLKVTTGATATTCTFRAALVGDYE